MVNCRYDIRSPCSRLVNETTLNAEWYKTIVNILECAVGLLIGTELVWNKIKKSGKQLIITTLTQSLGTFFVVSVVFAVVFYFTGIPLYLALIFGGIALATAPAPALSVVREFKTDGPVTRTLIPMAALMIWWELLYSFPLFQSYLLKFQNKSFLYI